MILSRVESSTDIKQSIVLFSQQGYRRSCLVELEGSSDEQSIDRLLMSEFEGALNVSHIVSLKATLC